MKFRTLYKRASSGAIQLWWMEANIDRYRTLHCVDGGEVIASDWTYPEAKNVGRANATTVEEQVKVEIANNYKKKLAQGKYTEDRSKVDEAKASYFSPMLAEKLDPDRLDGSFFIQPKFNGVRCIADKNGLWSRKGKEFVNTPHIHEALKDLFINFPNAIIDGELYNHDYKADFNNLVSAIRKTKPTKETQAESEKIVRLYVYDTFISGRYEVDFSYRWEWLKSVYTHYLDASPYFELSPTFRSSDLKTAQGLHERNKAAGYEGSIVRLNAPYVNKRSHNLMKYKDFKDAEFEILDVEEGKGNWSGVAKKVKLQLPPGVTSAAGNTYFHAGVKGDKEYCRRLLEDKANMIGKLGTIVYFELTPDGVPLFPIFQIVRDYE